MTRFAMIALFLVVPLSSFAFPTLGDQSVLNVVDGHGKVIGSDSFIVTGVNADQDQCQYTEIRNENGTSIENKSFSIAKDTQMQLFVG